MGIGSRLSVALVLALLGAVVGLAAVLLHGLTVGLVLGVVATALTAYALPGGWWRRLAFVLGWDAMLLRGVLPRSGGGYLVAADVHGYLLLVFGLVLLLAAITTVRPSSVPGTEDTADADAPDDDLATRRGAVP